MMTALCGAVGLPDGTLERLLGEFTAIWPNAAVEKWPAGLLAVQPGKARVHHPGEDGEWLVAADGESYVVDRLSEYARYSLDALSGGEIPSVPADWRGNGVVVNPDRGLVHLATEWTGTFPLFVTETPHGLAFSSHLRPLARAVGAEPDPLGAIEFLRNGYGIHGRTPFGGIFRLLPGQSLTRDGDGRGLRIREHSTLWARPLTVSISEVGELVENLWRRLLDALSDAIPESGRYGLMMSGGWDSRTLLAGLLKCLNSSDVLCYSHGDTRSREHDIVRRITATVGSECRLEPIDGSVWNPTVLGRRFEKTENVCFPSWHAVGENLQGSDVKCLTAGLFGPILGGHYGEPATRQGIGQIVSLAQRLRGHYKARIIGGGFSASNRGGADAAIELLMSGPIGSHWYLRPGFEESAEDVQAGINADIQKALRRLEERGITGLDAVLEAFSTEHRSAQFTNAQLMSCQPDLDIAFPLIDRRILELATQLPLELKINNYLNQKILDRHNTTLLDFPMAATLVKASRPIWLQELSRFGRRAWEDTEWKRYLESNGTREAPCWGWVNFEFLRDGTAFRRIREDLQSEFWNMEAIRKMEQSIMTYRYDERLHPVYDQMNKIYTLDLLYR